MIPEIGKSIEICLQTSRGTFVTAENKGGGVLSIRAPEAKEWEILTMTRIDDRYVSLQSPDGHYLCAESGGGKEIIANRTECGAWEKFIVEVDINGCLSFAAHNGRFVSANYSQGALYANAPECKAWECFLPVSALKAKNKQQTKIEVNVYQIGVRGDVAGHRVHADLPVPIWHTGVVISGTEYYFDSKGNKVLECSPKGMDMKYHRTITRFVPEDIGEVMRIFDDVKGRWDGARYDLFDRNCNFFVDDVLMSLGVVGLDREYLINSGAALAIAAIPGSSTLQELVVKWPVSDKRLDEAFMSDLGKRLSIFTAGLFSKSQVEKAGGDAAREGKKAGGDVARELKNAGGAVAGGLKKAFS